MEVVPEDLDMRDVFVPPLRGQMTREENCTVLALASYQKLFKVRYRK